MTKAVSATLISFYLFLLLLGATVQDLPTFFIFGEIGRTGVFLLLPVFLLMELYFVFMRKRITLLGKLEADVLFTAGWIFFISLVYCLYFTLIARPTSLFNESLITKGIKLSAYWILILLYLRQVNFCITSLGFKKSLKTTVWVYWTIVAVFLIELRAPSLLNSFHTHGTYLRGGIRLLTAETSWAGPVFVLLFLLNLEGILRYARKSRQKILLCFTSLPFGVFLFSSNSKGLWFCLALAVFTIVISSLLRQKGKIKIPFLAAIVFMTLFLLPYGLYFSVASLKTDIANYTSFSTRLTTNLAGMKIALMHPLGVGSAYLWYLPQEISNIAESLKSYNLNMQEIHNILTQDHGLSTKSGLMNLAIFGGFPVLLVLLFRGITLYRKVKTRFFFTGGLFFILFASLTYIDLSIKYEIWFFLIFLIHSYSENKSSLPTPTVDEFGERIDRNRTDID